MLKWAMCFLVLSTGGCFRSRLPHQYVLPVAGSQVEVSENNDGFCNSPCKVAFRVAEVNFPDYAKKSDLFSVLPDGRIFPMEFEEWSEPLDFGVTRALQRILAANCMPSTGACVASRAVEPSTPVKVDVSLSVFEHRFGENRCVAEGEFDVHIGEGNSGTRAFSFVIPSEAPVTPAAIVKCFGVLVQKLGDDIRKAALLRSEVQGVGANGTSPGWRLFESVFGSCYPNYRGHRVTRYLGQAESSFPPCNEANANELICTSNQDGSPSRCLFCETNLFVCRP